MSIRILINGASGKMGQATVKAIEEDNALTLAGTTGRNDNLLNAIKTSNADIVVDFTTAASSFDNAKTIIEAGAHPVIGTSGFLPEHITTLTELCAAKKLGGIIAPNFCIGTVLMMQQARALAQYMPDVEIIEMHHNQKVDAPSGTAMRTAELIAENRTAQPSADPTQKELIKGTRGARYKDIPIHAIRLPGLVAHQSVIFGAPGETLTLRHDTINRSAFMPGVCLACKKVGELDKLVYGLEHLLV